MLKKIFAAAVSLLMVLSVMVTPALAANANSNMRNQDYSITISKAANGDAGTKEYVAYRVIKGDIYENDGEKILSDVDWGEGVDLSETNNLFNGKTAKQTAYKVTTTELATAFANQINPYLTGGTALRYDSETETYKATGLTPGYYLVKEKLGSTDNEYEASTAFILEVLGNETVLPKSDIPSVEKKVLDVNDSTETAKTADLSADWVDSADYDAWSEDSVPFKLTATLPADNQNDDGFSNYETYKLIFNDTFEAGLSAPSDDIKDYDIYIGETKLSEEEKTTAGASVTTSANGFNLKIKDVKKVNAVAGGTVTVIYHLTLDKETAVIGSAGQANKVKLTYSNNPNTEGQSGSNGGEGGGSDTDHTGQTPQDQVRVFTYKVNLDKVTEDGDPLSGAVFKLEKKLQDGSYETIINEIPFNDGDETKYVMTGLDDGIYRVTETSTPRGYNSIKPFTFTIVATHDELADDPKLNTLSVDSVVQGAMFGDTALVNEITFTGDITSGSVAADVVNQKGVVLPRTGDVGTRMIYIAGILLVAAWLLYRRKRQGQIEAE